MKALGGGFSDVYVIPLRITVRNDFLINLNRTLDSISSPQAGTQNCGLLPSPTEKSVCEMRNNQLNKQGLQIRVHKVTNSPFGALHKSHFVLQKAGFVPVSLELDVIRSMNYAPDAMIFDESNNIIFRANKREARLKSRAENWNFVEIRNMVNSGFNAETNVLDIVSDREFWFLVRLDDSQLRAAKRIEFVYK